MSASCACLPRRTPTACRTCRCSSSTGLVVALILTSTFESIVNYIGVMLSLSAFLTVVGVFVLRAAEPNLPRPYRTPGYPLTPAVFLLVTGWMMFFVVRDRPMVLVAGAATLLAGLVIYLIDRWRAASAPTA